MGLLRQDSESLAGRLAFVDLNPIDVLEAMEADLEFNQIVGAWWISRQSDSKLRC